jgi:cell division protein FtsL
MNEFIDKDEAAEKEKIKSKQAKKAEKRAKPNAFVQILNGEFLAKDFVLNNLAFVFFLVFMMIMLVAKGYYGKQLTKDIDTAQKKLDASSAEYVEAKAKLEEETKRSELVDKLGPRGLKETTNPAKVIRVKKED